MTAHVRIALAQGDGIGPEIMAATLDLFRAAGVMEHLEFIPVEMGRKVFDQGDSRGMTDRAIRTTEDCGILFKGPMETPKGGGGKSINVTARKMWNAFANLRHFQTLPGVETVYSKAGINLNFYIVRENIEDTYGGIEHRLSNDVVQCKRLISAPGSDQVCRFAFQTARTAGITKVHCGHKANIMKMTDGLFLERFRAAAADFPDIEHGDVIVDALCMNLVLKPQQYQMVVLPNLQGDIVSDLAAGLVGGLGFAPSANIGRHMAIFEAVHGTAPDIAGKGIANPAALILSGLMMLRHLGMHRQAATIENALLAALEDGVRTGDFGDRAKPALGTRAFTSGIIDRLGSAPKATAARPVAADGDTPTFTRPPQPTAPQLVRAAAPVPTQIAGCDVYLDAADPLEPIALAAKLNRLIESSPFRLTLLSNRGTQVWPTGSMFTECVDYYRARFEPRESTQPLTPLTQSACLALITTLSAHYTIASYELLRTFNGAKGFSLAQGQ